MKTRKWLLAVALIGAVQPLRAQEAQNLGVALSFQGYSFPQALGATSATLLMLPVSYAFPLSRTVSIDAYSALARGNVKAGGTTRTLQGLTDTRIRANVSLTPWAILTASVNLPTGKATHDADEAVVATALSTELLGFREALWGTGFGTTAGLVTTWRAGATGIGFGASYRVSGQFEPSTDTPLKYAPGNETRVRFGIDHNIGTSKLTLGATFQNYSDDQLGGRNLFAPGNRWRGDATYSFRAGASSAYTLFATDVWRANGDVSLQIVDANKRVIGDSTFRAGQQNLAIFGIAGGTRLASGLALRPSADFRVLTRKAGNNEGWMSTVGTDIPMRRGAVDWIPTVRVSYGKLEDDSDVKHGFWGGEATLTLRFGGAR